MIHLKGSSVLVLLPILLGGCKSTPDVVPASTGTPKLAQKEGPRTNSFPGGVSGPGIVSATPPMKIPEELPRNSQRSGSIRSGMVYNGVSGYQRAAELGHPKPPPADEVVSKEYRLPNGSRGYIEGICRVTESSVECWSPDGQADKPLSERVEANLKTDSYGNGIQFKYGKKNRLVVIRQEQAANGNVGGYLNIESVRGYDPMGSMFFHDTNIRQSPGQPMVTERGMYVATEPDVKTVSLGASVTEQMPSWAELACKVGAETTLGDLKLKVVKISRDEQRTPPGYSFPNSNPKMWLVQIRVTNPTKTHWNIGASCLNTDGSPMYTQDLNGNPLSQQEMMKRSQAEMKLQMERQKQMEKEMKKDPLHRNFRGFGGMRQETTRPISIFSQYISPAVTGFSLNINPEKVAKFRVGASKSKVIEITGVRLDP